MRASDLDAVMRIAASVHADLPEARAVLAERLTLFPAGCWMTEGGYVIAHPARRGAVPPLDTLLGRLDPAADVLHLHDVALQPERQGQGLGAAAVHVTLGVAAAHGLAHVALVAVHGSPPYWARFGFQAAPADAALLSYGAAAVYMLRRAGADAPG